MPAFLCNNFVYDLDKNPIITRLLIQTQTVPVMVNLPGIMPMTLAQFSEFCLANRDLRIERTASGEVVIMPPVFSDTGNRNLKISQQLANWADLDGTGETFDSSTGFTLPKVAIRSPDPCWIKLESWNAKTCGTESFLCSHLPRLCDRVTFRQRYTQWLARQNARIP